MTIPAEIQWTQLPPLTFVSARVAIAGVLAPTAEVAGDSFDYALNGDTAQVAILDAMGHGMEATLMSAVAVAALRNSRRGGADLADTVRVMDDEIAKQFGADKFVTAIVGELDLATGWWRWVNCGHPPALLVRNGQVVKVLSEVAALPLGLGLLGDEPAVGEERLQPADRIVLYTDGVVEARDAYGDFFGVDRLVDFVGRHASAGRPVAETLRRLNHAVLGYQAGVLQDDATTVLIEWRPAQPEASIP
jgi:serine phosphatase RsbU (regulator of sigma subunit)